MAKKIGKPMAKSNVLQKNKLADQVLDQIMDWIMDGTLEMGDKLNTEELARTLGISRMPVREAINALERKGLAVSVPYAGMKIVNLSDEEVAEIYHIRQMLEPEAAYLACQRATEEEIAEIEQLFQAHVEAISQPEPNAKQVHLCNRAYHMGIYRASHMPRLCGIIEGLWDTLSFFNMIYGESFLVSEASRKAMIEEHRRYLDCLKTKNAVSIRSGIYINIDAKLNRYVNKERKEQE